jgi:hypothetical protein
MFSLGDMLYSYKMPRKFNVNLFTDIYVFSSPDIIAAGENPEEVLTIIKGNQE